MALSDEHLDGLHTNQSSCRKDDKPLSGDSSSGGIRIRSTEQESAAPTGLTYKYVQPETVCGKVKRLLADLLPGVDPEDLQVKYIGMGAYHRVVGFKAPIPKAATNGTNNSSFAAGEYVVRIQRTDLPDQNIDIEDDVAVLNGLAGKIDVPIPRVLMFDTEITNALGAPYTITTRLPGYTLKFHAGDENFTTEQSVCMVEKVTSLVQKLASITAPLPGLITSDDGEGMVCPNGITITMFDLPFDTLSLTNLTNSSPLTFMLELVNHWTTYEAAHLPSEEGNFDSWMKIKAIIHALSGHDILGSKFHLVHGDLAAHNIMGAIIDDSTVEITGVLDWDFASFAPAFCAYRAPLYKWDGGKDDAEECCEPEVLEAFKDVASPEYMKYAFSEEAVIARQVWAVLRDGMVGEYRRMYAGIIFREWDRLQLESRIGEDNS